MYAAVTPSAIPGGASFKRSMTLKLQGIVIVWQVRGIGAV
jgi:hypothetical protein